MPTPTAFRLHPYSGGQAALWTRLGATLMIENEEAKIRAVIAGALAEHQEGSGRPFDALLSMRQAEAIVKPLRFAGYEIRRV